MQHTATYCNTPIRHALHRSVDQETMQHTATYCNTPLRHALHRSVDQETMQHTATYCNTPIRHALHRSVDQETPFWWVLSFFVEESSTWARNSFLKVKHFTLVLIKKRSWWLLHKENPFWWLLHKENPFWWLLHINTMYFIWVLISTPPQKRRTVTHCNTLQHAATYCNIPIRHAFHFSVDMKESLKRNFFVEESFTLPQKRHAATRCNTLQHAATYCNTPTQNFFVEESSTPPQKRHTCNTLRHTATHCNTLRPPTATHQSGVSWWRIHLLLRKRDTLQHTATYCNTLQHTAKRLSSTEELLLKFLGGTFSAIVWSNSGGNCRTPLQKSLKLLHTWIICAINHFYMFHDPCMKYMWNESFLCVTWPIHMYDTTHFYVSYSCAHKLTAVFPSPSSASEFTVKKTEFTESHTPPHINLLFWFFSMNLLFFSLTLFRTWVHCLKQRNLRSLILLRTQIYCLF